MLQHRITPLQVGSILILRCQDLSLRKLPVSAIHLSADVLFSTGQGAGPTQEAADVSLPLNRILLRLPCGKGVHATQAANHLAAAHIAVTTQLG